MNLKNFYLSTCILGTIIPWTFFSNFFTINGINFTYFIVSLFANGAAGGFSADVLISIIIFWVWVFYDAREHRVKRWWLVFPAGFAVGLSLAMPLYLYLRYSQNEPSK